MLARLSSPSNSMLSWVVFVSFFVISLFVDCLSQGLVSVALVWYNHLGQKKRNWNRPAVNLSWIVTVHAIPVISNSCYSSAYTGAHRSCTPLSNDLTPAAVLTSDLWHLTCDLWPVTSALWPTGAYSDSWRDLRVRHAGWVRVRPRHLWPGASVCHARHAVAAHPLGRHQHAGRRGGRRLVDCHLADGLATANGATPIGEAGGCSW